jgi:hypothetical protein
VALVSCPKCSASLKVPDGSAAAVRCPKCKTVFRPPAPQPAFEVVEDEPAPPKATPKAAPKPAAKPAAKPAPEFELDDEEAPPPPKKKRVAGEPDDEDEDRPRARRRDDDEDEEDRPRARRRSRDEDEEDDEDDRPRKKKRRRGSDDDGNRRSVGPAKTGLMLLSISLWLYGGAVALLAFYLLLGWMGVGLGYGLFVLPGIAGMANWVVAIVGIGFCIANPKVRGLAIAAVCVAAVHLGLTFYDATDTGVRTRTETTQSGNRTTTIETREPRGGQQHGLFAAMAVKGILEEQQARRKELEERLQKNPREFEKIRKEYESLDKEAAETGKSWSNPSLYWEDFGTMLVLLDGIGAELIYNSKHFGDHVLGLLAAACELARLILVLVLVGAVAQAGRAGDAAGKSKVALIGVCIAAGACVIIGLVFALIVQEGKPTGKIWGHLFILLAILLYLTHAAQALVSAFVTQIAKSDVD